VPPVRAVAGFVLVAVGLLGLLFPIMPGWIFLIPGLVLLAERFSWARRLLAWAKARAAKKTSR
jgi:uncharacterized membrane protein YbaN (DUF454 family)